MTDSLGGAGAAYSELLLKTPPPRAPRHLLARSRLGLEEGRFRDAPIVLVQAPPGFGKTSLVAQWRREHLAHGAAVAWFSADSRDDPKRLINGLVLAVRVGCARPAFGRSLLEDTAGPLDDMGRVTAWLAEVAQTSLDLVLVVDETEPLPATGFAALTYLLHNAPPNLRVIIAARSGFDEAVGDLAAYGQSITVGSETLRFRIDETIALVHSRCGNQVDADTCARLHELTEGWPLGLQLALAAIEQGADPGASLGLLSAGSGDKREQLVRGLFAKLGSEDIGFLTRIACVDQIHPDLCRALTGLDTAPERLARLMRDTPIFVAGDDSAWCRLHALARDAFRTRLAELPGDEQAALHGRALHWLIDHGLIEEAARHAHAAGQEATAFDLAERSVYQAVSEGNLGVALDWLERLPVAELTRRPRLRLAAAWALAFSERHQEAEALVASLLADPGADTTLRNECALIVSGAAYFADDPDRCLAAFAPWLDTPPLRDPRRLQLHANRLSVIALLRGDPAQARRHQQLPRGTAGDSDRGLRYAARCGEFFTGLSYVWEGQILLAENFLRPALRRTEAEFGRRHSLACMLAALLATVVYERDRIDEAAALLANRLDVLERSGTPDAALLGYRTAARVAAAQGAEHRALDLLEALHAVGVARRLPRLCIASLADQIRLHAGRFRSETCRELAQRIDTLLDGPDLPLGPLWRNSVAIYREMSHANAAIAAKDWRAAAAALAVADSLAETQKLTRMRIEIMALRAYTLDRNSDDGRPLLKEAMNLAQTYGLVRTFVDAHPALADWARRIANELVAGEQPAPTAPSARLVRPVPYHTGGPRAVPSMVLTPKERTILELLARNLSNKEIAQAMAVGEETIKWHLKNLFGKLDAATRKHAVRRAHILGLLEGGD